MRVFISLVLCLGIAAPALAQTDPRPRPRPEVERCSPDGSACIRLASYTEDVCTLIEDAAEAAKIDTGFFARLLWRESLFDAAAVSPAGAQGIAQFMPGTAALRALADPFNPAEAIPASADYLADLTEMFGNLGLAAAAYNSGEARTADFVTEGRRLPGETRAYVRAITGHSATDWRDAPPEDVDFALAPDIPFQEACRTQAATRTVKTFTPPPPRWGVIVAAGRRRATVERFVETVRSRHGRIIGGRDIRITDGEMAGFGRAARLTALIVTDSEGDARDLCRRLQSVRAFCKVAGPR